VRYGVDESRALGHGGAIKNHGKSDKWACDSNALRYRILCHSRRRKETLIRYKVIMRLMTTPAFVDNSAGTLEGTLADERANLEYGDVKNRYSFFLLGIIEVATCKKQLDGLPP
jgi:hypothetical protein